MTLSLGISEIGCAARAAIFSLAISDEEFLAMGLPREEHAKQTTTPLERVRRLRALQRFSLEQPAVARRLGDILDLAYADTLLHVRALDDDTVQLIARAWLEDPEPRALPGLIWALCTDRREIARAAGVRLAREAAWLGAQALFHPTALQQQQ